MNEKIKALAKQAGWNPARPPYGKFSQYDEFDHEKFAELIVRECVNQVKEQYIPVSEDAAMMNDEHWKGYKHCGVDSVVAIREHFGVEE